MDRTKSISTVIVSLIIVSTILFCTAGTVSGKGKCAASDDAAYYHQLENSYVSQARSVMNAEGYINSGITMIHRVDAEGTRTYVVRLHHERLTGMPQEKRSELFAALTSIGFEDGKVLYEII